MNFDVERAQPISAAVEKAILHSSNVLIMGHKYSDSDSLGAAVGMLKFCKDLGKSAKIVISVKTSLATLLVNHLKKNDLGGELVSVEEGKKLVKSNTLLIIVDTHRAPFFESREIYESVRDVIVIDHHEKSSDCVEDAHVFYQDSSASSASEMVTQLIYCNEKINLTPVYANALLSGIMLDTRDFMLRTTPLTFECAAYLRSSGADIAAVKQFFNNSLKNKKLKGKIVVAAYEYENCAISVAKVKSDNIRIICSQAADELLMVSDVVASFVLFETDNTVNISARSNGEVNVRLIMEAFSGGGHMTMAACQLEGADIEQVRLDLERKLDEYFANNK